jgi:phosphatidate cytidylyltransferase
MKDLPKRALTAVLFAIVMLGGMLWNRLSFSLLILLIQSGCLYEYLILIKSFQQYERRKKKVAIVVTMILASAVMVTVSVTQSDMVSIEYAVFFIPACLILLALEMIYRSVSPVVNGMLNAGAIIYISLPVLMLYSLTDNQQFFESSLWHQQVSVPLGIVFLIWANDTFAYFVGSMIGKHKMLPSVSPKKSWEGFFGGLVFALITGWILAIYFPKLDLLHWLIVAVIVVLFGTIGDFFESMIKRQAGVKDSGNILPGHGGFLDRFDALLFCVPFVAVYLLLFPN